MSIRRLDEVEPKRGCPCVAALDLQDRVRVERAFGQWGSGFDMLAVTDQQARGGRGMLASEIANKRFDEALRKGTIPGMPAA